MDVTAYIDGLLARAERSPLFGDAAFPGLYPLYNDLQVLRAKLEQPLHAAVIGEVKAGKSTLINAFAGGEISPTNATETTACIMKISYSPEEKAVLHFSDGRSQEGTVAEIYELLEAHHGDQAFFSRCRDVEVGRNLQGLRHICLIDTPGLETITTANESRTTDYFQSVDVVLWVFNGNYLGQSDVNDRVRQVAQMGKPIVAVINRIDQVDGDPQDLVDYLDDSMGIYLEEIFPLSAQKAYEGVRNGDRQLRDESGFTALYAYLDEHIERHAGDVQTDSILASARVLEDKMNLLYRQTLEQIERKLRTYMELDEQIQYNGRMLSEKVLSDTREWLQRHFLSRAERTLYSQISAGNAFSSSSQEEFQRLLQKVLSQDAIRGEIEDYLQQLSATIRTDWQGRLSGIDAELSHMYEQEQEKNRLEMVQLPHGTVENTGLESVKSSVLAAGAAGGALSIYSAVVAPAAAHVTLGAAVSTIMPPVLLAGAAVGLVTGYAKSKKVKTQQRQQVQDVLGMVREKTAATLLPALKTYLQQLCEATQSEAKKDFVEKNFAGRSVQDLQQLVEQLKQIVRQDEADLRVLD